LAWYCQKHLTTHTHHTSTPHKQTTFLFTQHQTTSHLTHSEKLPLHQRQLTRSTCWTLDHWMLGGLVAGVTPLACLENVPRPHMISLDAPAFSISLSRTSSDNQFGDRNPGLLRTQIADCLLRNDYSFRLNIIITQLEQVVMQCNVISFQLFYGSTIYRPVCLFLYINLRIHNREEFAYEAS
jgi:hypothetical protein